jgi:P27 family predicted phage terminase small subunit
MRGRRPKPSALKRLQGNPGKRKLNDREPEFDASALTCPDFVQGAARREWHRTVALLSAANVVTTIDRTVLAAYCQNYERWVDASAQLRKTGPIIKAPSGYPIVNPLISVVRGYELLMSRQMVELGMTPSSRSRLRIEQPEKTEDPLDAFLKRAPGTPATARVQ